jgi:hypothetical protein
VLYSRFLYSTSGACAAAPSDPDWKLYNTFSLPEGVMLKTLPFPLVPPPTVVP